MSNLPGTDRAQPTINAIHQIVDLYARDWEKNRLPLAKAFLANTWSGIPLPTLTVCGRGTQEIRYSAYLGYFLDITKPHGLGARYLEALLEHIGESGVDSFQAVTETEKYIGDSIDGKEVASGYCDIVITTRSHVIFIENKIKSSESKSLRSSKSQLLRYEEGITGNEEFAGKAWIKIFLTTTSEKSQHGTEWISVTHEDLVRIGLRVLNTGGLPTVARENLKRFMMDLLLGPYDKEEENIQKLMRAAEQAVFGQTPWDRMRFDRMAGKNQLMLEVLMEG